MYFFECKLALDPLAEFTQRIVALPDPIRPAATNQHLMNALEGADRVKEKMDIDNLDMNVNQFDRTIFEFISIDIKHAQGYAKKLFPYFKYMDDEPPDEFIGLMQGVEWEWHGVIDDPGPIEIPNDNPFPYAQPEYEQVDVRIDNIWALKKNHIMLFLTACQVDQMSDEMKLAYFDKVCNIAYEAHLRYTVEEMENELEGSRHILIDPDEDLSAE